MHRYAILLALAIAAFPEIVTAASITYTETATGTGTLDGTAFTNALVTVTLLGDTSNVAGGSCCWSVSGTATVSVAGVGADTLTDDIHAFRTNCPSCNGGSVFVAAGIYDNTMGTS